MNSAWKCNVTGTLPSEAWAGFGITLVTGRHDPISDFSDWRRIGAGVARVRFRCCAKEPSVSTALFGESGNGCVGHSTSFAAVSWWCKRHFVGKFIAHGNRSRPVPGTLSPTPIWTVKSRFKRPGCHTQQFCRFLMVSLAISWIFIRSTRHCLICLIYPLGCGPRFTA